MSVGAPALEASARRYDPLGVFVSFAFPLSYWGALDIGFDRSPESSCFLFASLFYGDPR